MPRVGVIGSMVWDEIHGRDPVTAPIEEWGGIAYALGAMDAALPDDWQVVPLIKVGRDLSSPAAEFLQSLQHLAPGTRFIEVPSQNQRVTLHYRSSERRCERMTGGVPPWTWGELGPMVSDLDALYINFISGHELSLATAEALRHAFGGPIYADLHSLLLGTMDDGTRILQHLPEAPVWFSLFDMVQCNEDELEQLGRAPMEVMVDALREGVSLFCVTRGPRGVVYLARPGFDRLDCGGAFPRRALSESGAVRTESIAPPATEAIDPTGCGDVFGATCFARLLAGDVLEKALEAANVAASRNAAFRGASRLNQYLRGRTVLT